MLTQDGQASLGRGATRWCEQGWHTI